MQESFSTYFPWAKSSSYIHDMIRTGRPAKKNRSDFGQRLYEARERAGLTQMELAQKLGVIQQVVAAWERRNNALKLNQIKALAQALGTSSDYLLGVSNSSKVSKGPSGKARQLFETVSHLPRRQQQKIVEVVEALVDKVAPTR